MSVRAAALAPGVFVLLWSSGFIGAKLGLPHAAPLTFLAVRFAIVVALFVVLLVGRRLLVGTPIRVPSRRMALDLTVVGLLVHAAYLGGVFVAVDRGLEAGVSALIVGASPILTALLARRWLGERIAPVQALGMALAVAGVALVVARKLGAGLGDMTGALLCIAGAGAFAAGAIVQKQRLQAAPLIEGATVQYAAAAVAAGLAALALEDTTIDWAPPFVLAMAWLVLALSFGAILLFAELLRRGEASRVASLVFLTPAATAVLAAAIFGETLGPTEIVGALAGVLGVALVTRPDGRLARAAARRLGLS